MAATGVQPGGVPRSEAASRPVVPAAAPGLAWHWSAAFRGAVYVLPAAVVAFHDPGEGLALAVGVLPAASLGLPATRKKRLAIPVVGSFVAVSMFVGTLLTHIRPFAALGVFALAILAAVVGQRKPRLGMLAMNLGLPVVGVGLSYDEFAKGFAVVVLIVAGSLYAWLVAMLWPQRAEVPRARAEAGGSAIPGPLARTRRDALDYGVRVGTAGAVATVCGLSLAPTHPGWPVVAALMVMRPVAEMQRFRSIGRVISVLVGGAAALLLLRTDPAAWVYALTVVVIIAAVAATVGSRWYVTPAFTTVLVLLLLLEADAAQARGRFNERVAATLVGVALAYFFGLAIPHLRRRRADRPR